MLSNDRSIDNINDLVPKEADFLLYSTPEGSVHVGVFFYRETVWLTQKRMAELFGVQVNTINYHLREVFENAELKKKSVIRKFRITAVDGKIYDTQFYNLDVIIPVDARRGIIGRNGLKERGVRNVVNCIRNKAKSAFFQVLTEISEIAIINLLKPPVLTARHGGVLFFKTKT